ncbi:MAG: hypothetical protein NT010_01485 [Proteobacteria bacterium]|nr:hypothetical protein [Pseudomonadota bacterium]
MNTVDLAPIKELYDLWNPVYPYLTRHIGEIYGREGGDILEMGPFCGAVFSMKVQEIGDSFSIASFPQGMRYFFREEAKKHGSDNPVRIIESNASLAGVTELSIDLVIFRGALFFPSLFSVDFSAIYRVLREKGVAMVGGGFGKYTPKVVIDTIGERSRDLNLRIGKTEIMVDGLYEDINTGKIPGHVEIVSEGGLWVIMKK